MHSPIKRNFSELFTRVNCGALPGPPHGLAALGPRAHSHGAGGPGGSVEAGHPLDRRSGRGRGAGVDRSRADGEGESRVGIERNDRSGGGAESGGARHQERELSVRGGHELEAPEHFGGRRFGRCSEFGTAVQ